MGLIDICALIILSAELLVIIRYLFGNVICSRCRLQEERTREKVEKIAHDLDEEIVKTDPLHDTDQSTDGSSSEDGEQFEVEF